MPLAATHRCTCFYYTYFNFQIDGNALSNSATLHYFPIRVCDEAVFSQIEHILIRMTEIVVSFVHFQSNSGKEKPRHNFSMAKSTGWKVPNNKELRNEENPVEHCSGFAVLYTVAG
jgi:hypothetical protein